MYGNLAIYFIRYFILYTIPCSFSVQYVLYYMKICGLKNWLCTIYTSDLPYILYIILSRILILLVLRTLCTVLYEILWKQIKKSRNNDRGSGKTTNFKKLASYKIYVDFTVYLVRYFIPCTIYYSLSVHYVLYYIKIYEKNKKQLIL